MQVPNGTGPGVWRSKRPLLASRTRCNVLWKPPKFGNKVKIGIKVQFGNKFANRCNFWSIEGMICVYLEYNFFDLSTVFADARTVFWGHKVFFFQITSWVHRETQSNLYNMEAIKHFEKKKSISCDVKQCLIWKWCKLVCIYLQL